MNASEFLDALAAHSILSITDLGAVRGTLPADKLAADAEAVAKELVGKGLLTRYQAAHVYKGRAKALVFGEYIVLDKLGAGGMGQVFKAQHRRMKRTVALKVLPPQTTNSARAVQRFYQEVEMAARLSHPNIVTAYDAGEAHGLHYLAMECVDGKDLSYIVTRCGPLAVDQAMFCVKQAARGLQYAHEQGIIHRDVKPSNLLVDRRSVVKILDLGLARLTESLGRPDDSAGLTEAGQVLGTVDYMAPEQAHDTRSADHRADIYSLGCTLFRLLTDKVPYPADTVLKKILAHREQPIPSLRSLRENVPPRLDQLCQRMLAKDPAQRVASMSEVAATLDALLAGKSDEASSVAVLDEQPADEDWQSFLKSSKDCSGSSLGRNAPQDAAIGSVAQCNPNMAGEQAGKRKLRRTMAVLGGAVVGTVLLIAAVRMLVPGAADESVHSPASPAKQATAEASSPPQTAPANTPPELATTNAAKPARSPPASTGPSPPPASPPPARVAAVTPVSNLAKPAPETIANSAKKPAPPPVSKPASTAPASPPPVATVEALTGPVDLLKRVAVPPATFGKWSLEPAGLVLPQTDFPASRIAIPFVPPEDYDLTLSAEGPVTKSEIRMGLVVGGTRTSAILYPQKQGRQIAFSIGLGTNDLGLRELIKRPVPSSEANADKITILYIVRHGRVCIKIDGNWALDWAGDPATLTPNSLVGVGDVQSLALGISGAVGTGGTVGDVRITHLEIAPPTAVLPTSSRVDLLARYAVADEGNSEAVVAHGEVTLQGRSATAAAYASFATPRPSEYTLSMVIERTAGAADMLIGLPIGNHIGVTWCRGDATFFENTDVAAKQSEILPGRLHTVNWVIGAKQTALLIDNRSVVDFARPSTTVGGSEKTTTTMGIKPGGQRVYFRIGEGCGYCIRGLEITPAGWQKLRRPQSDAMTAARKSLDNRAPAGDATAAQKLEAAGDLWRQAAESLDDDALRYVSLETAAMLAAGAGDLSLACHAATDLARTFEGDFHDLFERLVAEAFRVARSPDERKAIVDTALAQIDLAVAWEQFDLALALQAAALPVAKPPTSDLVKELKARGLELQLSAAESKRYQAAQQKHLAGKADAAAYADIAEYLATVRNDWPGAAREFEAAGRAPLRDLARAEASRPNTPARQLELAELWWDWADKSEPLLKYLAAEHALAWTVRAEAGGAKPAKAAAAHHRQMLLQQRRTSNLAFFKRHPLDAVKVGNSWFKLYSTLLNWHEAATLCEDLGGSLPIIDSSAKNQAVAQTLMTLSVTGNAAQCWLGLTDSDSEGNWRWVDHSPLGPGSFKGWTGLEPDNNGGNQNHAALNVSIVRGQPATHWSDEIEGRLYPVLCEWRQ